LFGNADPLGAPLLFCFFLLGKLSLLFRSRPLSSAKLLALLPLVLSQQRLAPGVRLR
jgi:hypothetical protein